ncbi:uncharacterized protein LOC123680873 [Harmonia axyridis]|uniref:uncharacterized protein LOC123680873 n=1 Tax=Harmonia axyridis TaxID=115357 RepID=UPI001E279213|nr:uncharacterized protein LOC123680873 [Harmonia axyridis]
MKSELFETKEGLRQGGVLSPTLFIVFLDEIIREAKERTEKLTIGFKNLRRVVISECAFADDIVLMAGTRRSIQGNLDIWNGILRKYGMEINRRKTKVMEVNDEREDDWRLEIEGEEVEKVECSRYLGVNIENTGSQEREINERIEKAGRLYHAINKKFLRRTEVEEKTKMTVFKSIFRPVLSYGCETWNTTKRMRSKLQAVEIKFLRGMALQADLSECRSILVKHSEDLLPHDDALVSHSRSISDHDAKFQSCTSQVLSLAESHRGLAEAVDSAAFRISAIESSRIQPSTGLSNVEPSEMLERLRRSHNLLIRGVPETSPDVDQSSFKTYALCLREDAELEKPTSP